jgi:hypothetical protein
MKERNYSALCDWAKGHPGVYVSRNAFKKETNVQHYFLTFRLHTEGKIEAVGAYDDISKHLRSDGWEILKSEKEYVVYDSNIELDRGWASLDPH